jgi:hypothetical protein
MKPVLTNTPKDFDEAACLQVDPFAGDYGSPGDKTLRDSIVTARKACECGECLELTEPGTRTRVIVAIFDGELHHYRYCAKCCDAMSISEKDDGKAWEKRRQGSGRNG